MSAADFLAKLLGGADVEWVPLGDHNFFEVANTARRPVKASLRARGKIPYYGANNIQDYVKGHTHEGEYVLIAEDGSASLENYSIQYVCGKFWANNHVHVVRGTDVVDTRFLFHYLTTANFIPFLSSAERAKLTKGRLVEILVPIPCPHDQQKSMAIQGEIARILDSFSQLTSDLTAALAAELTARKRQYSHYRDWLLNFEGADVEWKPLNEIGEFIRGKRFTKADYVDDGLDVIHYGEIYTRFGVHASEAFSQVNRALESSLRFAEPNDVILTDVGETVDEVGKATAWLGKTRVAIHDHCYAFRHKMNPKFVAYCMQTTDFIARKFKHVAQTKVNTLLIRSFATEKIPVPFPSDTKRSLQEQARIVAILDKFDQLTTSLTEALPREIGLREKQYAWYRDQLLSFPKPDNEAAR